MNEKRGGLFLVVFILLVIILLTSNISAIGIRAPKVKETFDFSPNLKIERNYQIVTNAGKTMDYEVYGDGELKNYISVDPERFYSIASGQNPTFHAILQLPEADSEIGPGLHDARFCAAETETLGEGGGQIGVKTSSCAVIWIRTLYEQKWIEFVFNAPSVNHGETIHFTINVKSWTKQDINNINAKITIKNKETGEILETLITQTETLPSNEEVILETYLETINFLPGKYSALLEINYDGLTKIEEKDFVIGTLDIAVLNYTKQLENNKIDKFYVTLENKWNNKIESVSLELEIDKENYKSETFSLEARQKKEIMMYVDTNPLEMGEQKGILKINYDEESRSQDIIIKIIKGKDRGIQLSLINIILIIVVIILIITFILAFIFFILKNKEFLKKKKEKQKKLIKKKEDDDW